MMTHALAVLVSSKIANTQLLAGEEHVNLSIVSNQSVKEGHAFLMIVKIRNALEEGES